MRRTRRDMLVLLASLPVGAFAGRPPGAPDALRLLVHGRPAGDAADGLWFGISESTVTASLMGRELQVGAAAAAVTGAIGVLAAEPAGAADIPPATPVLPLADFPGPAPGTCTFRVAPTVGEREAALARWAAGNPAAAGSLKAPRIAAWHPSLFRYGAGELNDRYRKQTGRRLTAEAWLAWFAVKALVDSALRQPGMPPCQALVAARFDGHKGRPLRFAPDTRALRQPLYVVDADRVAGEVFPEDAP